VTTRSRHSGAALILVLWSIVILALLAGGLSFAIRQDLAIANLEKDRIVAHCLARAGVERAVAEIMDDTGPTDALDDTWCDNEPAMHEIELSGGTFSVLRDGYEAMPSGWYGAGDESAKLNVNVATLEQLLKLPDMTESIAAAIIDWRDADEEAQPDGIERGYYASLTHPYEIRNGSFRTVRELLLLRGVTPELLYGEDRNVNGLLDPNEDDGDTSEPHDNSDGRLDRGWFAYVTVDSYERNVNGMGEKRLNLNQADAQELSRRTNLEPWAAESVVKARERNQFEHLADVLEVRRDPDVRRDSDDDADYYTRGDGEKDQPVTTSIFVRIVDDLTLSDDEILGGRINVNTAPLITLNTLPGMDNNLAEAIIRHRESLGTFTSTGQVLNVSGATTDKFSEFENHITVRSNVFRIQSTGVVTSGFARAAIECVVDRYAGGNGGVPRILYWLESSP